MLRETKSDQPHLQLNAEDMEFMVSKKQARTANREEILYDSARVEAIGLHFSIKDRLLNLLSNVRGQYASPQD